MAKAASTLALWMAVVVARVGSARGGDVLGLP